MNDKNATGMKVNFVSFGHLECNERNTISKGSSCERRTYVVTNEGEIQDCEEVTLDNLK